MRWIARGKVRRPALRRAALVGVAAGSAYLAEEAIDMRLAANRYDDLLLWGGFVTRRPRRARLAGAGVHYTLSVAFATLYAALGPALPGRPGWLRGLLFVQAENAVLYPGVPLINAVHPGVRAGALPSLLTWRYFWVEIARHAAFGAVLGALSEE